MFDFINITQPQDNTPATDDTDHAATAYALASFTGTVEVRVDPAQEVQDPSNMDHFSDLSSKKEDESHTNDAQIEEEDT